jgi:hypothetical protein
VTAQPRMEREETRKASRLSAHIAETRGCSCPGRRSRQNHNRGRPCSGCSRCGGHRQGNRIITKPVWILGFALAFALFILLPPLLGAPFPFYTSIAWADALDLATPMILLPLYRILSPTSVGLAASSRRRSPSLPWPGCGPRARGCIYLQTPSGTCWGAARRQSTR